MKSNTKSALHLSAAVVTPPRRFLPALLLPLLAAGLLPVSAPAQTITSAVPGYITYQGKVTNANGTAVGAGTPVNRTVIFRIWSHQGNSTAADLVYSEQQTVTISEGEFSVLIGQGTAVAGTPLGYSESSKGPPTVTFNNSFTIFGGAARYLGVTVDDGSGAADPEISPRQQIVTSAYAFRARFAEGLGSNGGFSVAVTDQGNFGVGLANPAFPITTAATLGDKIGLFGNFNYGLGIQLSTVQLHGASASDDITFGYGTSAAMTETVRFKGNGNVGIGTATPTAKLDVNGAINVLDGGVKALPAGLATEVNAAIINFGINDNRFGTANTTYQGGFLRFDSRAGSSLVGLYARPAAGTAVSEIVSITSAGNVGIGTAPGTKLEVAGGVRASGASGFTFNGGGDTDGGLFSPADGTVTLRTNNAERLRVDASGNVGIGTNAPTARLDVAGAFHMDSTGAVTIDAPNVVGGRLYIGTSGNVGLGTSAPGAKLHVAGGVKVDSTNVIELGAGVTKEANAGKIGYNSFTSDALDIVGAGTTGSNRKIRFWNEGNAVFTGWVGVTNSSPAAPLHVSNWTGINSYVEANGNVGGFGDVANQYWSIAVGAIVDSGVRASQFFVNSDARIKRVQGRSSGAADLATLQQIEVTDYTYLDKVTHGGRVFKKAIAQQVEQVFPQAVSQSKGVLPDILQTATCVAGWITATTDLKVGERVRLIGDGGEAVHEVLEVQPGRFRTTFKPMSEKVVVYGREVKDFRTVDYEAIAMLNVSATQEIKREKDTEVAALRAQNETLVKRVAELEAKDRARDAKLASIEKLLQANQTVMASPAKPTTSNHGQE